MISFYCLPSSIIGNKKYNLLYAAYSFYNVPGKTPLDKLFTDAMILATNVSCGFFVLHEGIFLYLISMFLFLLFPLPVENGCVQCFGLDAE